jgi:hypothetical protein
MISKIDVVKTVESFIDPGQRTFYKYSITRSILYNDIPVYVLHFEPFSDELSDGRFFEGEIFVHRESFAVVHVSFGLNKYGLKKATSSMIKRKPVNVSAKPTHVNYVANYQYFDGFWHLSNIIAEATFKVRSRKNRVNSEYQSITDVLITDIQNTGLRRFPRETTLKPNDIFTEMINSYDEKFWDNYNIIRPDEDLRNAIKNQFNLK